MHKEKVLFLVGLLFLICTLGSSPAIAQLPQDHGYQVTLRDYIGTLQESDFEVTLSELTVDPGYFSTVDETYQAWLVFGYEQNLMPISNGVRVDASHFTLSAIEAGGNVNMNVGKSQWISPLATAFWADWNYPGNPHYGKRAVKLRAFVSAAVDMMMQDRDHENGNNRRSDFLGLQLIRWAYAYGVAKEELPQQVREVFETGLIKMFERLEQWGPTGTHADMDMGALVGMLYTAQFVDSEDLTQRAKNHIDLILDKHLFDAGYIDHGSAYDAGYNGISQYFVLWATQISDYASLQQAMTKMAEFKAYQILPDPDGEWNSPYHTNPSSGADAAHDLWSPYYRDVGIAEYSDEAVFLALQGGDKAIHDEQTMISNMDGMLQYVHDPSRTAFTEPDGSSPSTWEHEHWISTKNMNSTAHYYKDGLYDRLRTFQNTNSSYTKPPFSRSSDFMKSFADKFLSVKQNGYGAIIFNDRLSWWTGEGETETLNGFGGGNLSAFWTPQTGTVLLGATRTAHNGGLDLVDWRIWPVHALSGETAGGNAFSSGLQRHPEATYELNRDTARVTVTGDLTNIYSDMTNGLGGQATYQRVFRIEEDGLRVTTSVTADSSNSVDELYEILPVFRRDAYRQSSATPTAIDFEVDGSWQSAGTSLQQVTRIRLRRFNGTVIIDFAEPARVKLSPQEFYREPDNQNSTQVRNVMIDLLGSGPAPLGNHAIEYTIFNPDVASNSDWGDETDSDTTAPKIDVSYSPSNPDETDEITFSATAEDSSGISKIEIYVSDSLEKTCEGSTDCKLTGGPYPVGDVSYQAIAYDAAGEPNKAESSVKKVSVSDSGDTEADTTAPKISVSHSPSNPDDTEEITFSATAEDNSGISKIEMYINDSLEKTCEESTNCEVVGGPYSAGDVSYRAIAYDAAGESNKTESNPETISVSEEEQTVNNHWPTVNTPKLVKDMGSLHVKASKVQDEDGDSVFTNIDWRIDGESISLINYSFDVEGSVAKDSLAKDFTSYQNHGKQKTESYIPSWTAKGRKAGAYYFDGQGDHIYTPTSDKIESLKAFTIEFWMKHDNWGEEWASLVSKPYYNNKWEDPWSVFKIGRDGPRDQLNFQITVSDGKAVSIQSQSDIPNDQWVHVVGTYDGNMLKLFINGELDKQIQVDEPLVSGRKTGIYLGSKWGQENEQEAYRGLMDEFRLFNRALSSQQVERHYATKYTDFSLDEVSDGEKWTALVTPTDTKVYGESKESNALVIEQSNDEDNPELTLSQNFPNPFRSETNIEYTLPEEEMEASLIIYNILGRKVATLVDTVPQSGAQEVPFDASDHNLSSGVYFYRLIAGDTIFLKKMTYIK